MVINNEISSMGPSENSTGSAEMSLETQIIPNILDGSDPNSRVIEPSNTIDDLLSTVIPPEAHNPIGDISSEVDKRQEFVDVYPINKLDTSADPNRGVQIRYNVDVRRVDELDEHGKNIVDNLFKLSTIQGVQREYAAMRISVGDKKFTVYHTSNHPFGVQPEDYDRANEILYKMAEEDSEIASHLTASGGDGTGIVVEHFHTHPDIVAPIQSVGDIMAMQVHQNTMMMSQLGPNATWKSHVIPMQNNGEIISTFDPQKNFANQEGIVQLG